MANTSTCENNIMVYGLTVNDKGYEFTSSIESAMEDAELELEKIDKNIEEIEASLKKLKPECDKIDYILAASSGALCGIIDIFLVGKPGESLIGNLTDKWFSNRVCDFSKLCGWSGGKDSSSAIRFLEKKFKIPYDQNGLGDIAKGVLDLNPSNHHFKSLAHNPNLLGLFFSILDQFSNTSHFVSDGNLIVVDNSDSEFRLQGNNIPGKLVCGFVNWLGHIMSDISGASGSKTRGMGIPSPIWSWTNDVIALLRKMNISPGNFVCSMNEAAVKIFEEGFDFRFQTAQVIPVFVNEMIVRIFYFVRRMLKYFSETEKSNRSFTLMWKKCEPFKNVTVKRMLTVAHGTFCLVDIGDATVRGFVSGGGVFFNPIEFCLRLNIVGIGRFAISLYGEAKRAIQTYQKEKGLQFVKRERVIVLDYIEGLKTLSVLYDDRDLVNFIDDFKNSDMYIQAFEKTVKLAELRKVPDDEILRVKSDIDSYFLGEKKWVKKS